MRRDVLSLVPFVEQLFFLQVFALNEVNELVVLLNAKQTSFLLILVMVRKHN